MYYFFRKLWLLIVLIAIMSGCTKMESIEFSKSYSIKSSYTGSEYNLEILYPEKYDSLLEYQIIYLLDGDFYFNELAEIVKSKYASYGIVLVGIGYKNENKRTTDFTYPSDDMFSNSGGGKNYIQFINNELIPYITNNLSIKSSEITLAGHSLGGYFALYQLFQQDYPNPFDHIIAASPALYWHEAYILDLESQYNASKDTLNVKLYTTMGDLEAVSMNTMFNAFNQITESGNYIGLSFEHERFENTSHQNNPIISFDKGISFIHN